MKYADRMQVVRGSVIRDVATEIAARNNPELIKLSGGLPDGALFPKAQLKAVTEGIFANDDLIVEALQYGLTRGDTELVELLVNRLNKNEKMDITPANLVVTTGCQQGIALAAIALLNEEDTIVIEKPSYLDGLNACLPYKPNIVGVDTDEYGIMLDKLEETLDANPKTKIIYVIPNFQNPTGKAWPLEKRKAFLELVSKEKYKDITVLEDNPYGEIRFRGEFIPSLKALDTNGKVVYLGSFSKILSPGLRVAYMVADDAEFIDKIEEIKEGQDLQSNQFAQVQVREYMKQYDLDAHIETLRASYKAKCDVMIATMEKEFPESVSYVIPDGGMFLWVVCPEQIDTGALLSTALDNLVSYIPGASFFADGSGKNTMRLNFTANDADKLVEGIRRLAAVFKAVL